MKHTGVFILLIVISILSANHSMAQNYSMQFFGNGVNDIDRVKIRLDVPAKPVDVSGSFTCEFWMKAGSEDNNGYIENRNDGDGWITGNILIDRDIYGSGDFGDYGISIGTFAGGGPSDRGVCFGIDRSGNGRSIVASFNVADNVWHHIAVTRDSVSGDMAIFIDGIQRAAGTGPAGNISYRNNRSTSWLLSDPFLVLGAEKHDAGSAYPSYNGKIDELRISTTVRYSSNFTPPSSEFLTDQLTAALYHFNETGGDTVRDMSAATGGPSNGIMMTGGNPTGPVRNTDNPFTIFVNVVVLIEGLYRISADKMNAADTITISLHNILPPYNAVESARSAVDSVSFLASFRFQQAQSGNYFLSVRHRNSVETWSAAPLAFQSGANTNIDLTTSAGTAYGNNMILKGSRYCIYSGDINADGAVDGTDVLLADNAAFNFLIGYLPEDLNGDLSIDGTDISIADNNASAFVSKIVP